MKTEKETSVIRPTDEEARRLARRLLRGARFGALAALEPESGHPFASRVLLGTDIDGAPVMLSSALSTHTKAIVADPRCSVLVGEPGKGDPLAWPRLTIVTSAERLERGTESCSFVRERFLRRHPKSRLYVDFGDFSFFRLSPFSANLNGGFGKAYNILRSELLIGSPVVYDIAKQELYYLDEINARFAGGADLLVKHYFNEKTANWKVVSLDAEGFDLARKEQLYRIELEQPISSLNGVIAVYSELLKDIR